MQNNWEAVASPKVAIPKVGGKLAKSSWGYG